MASRPLTKSQKGKALIPSEWPNSCPLPDEHAFLSCSIGNTNIKWAVHNGAHDRFAPRSAWKTTHLSEEELSNNDTVTILARYLSNAGLQLVFGDSMVATAASATSAASHRPVYPLTVYFSGNEKEQMNAVANLFENIPSRLIQLSANDFISLEQGRTPNMGIDRMAALLAAGTTFGYPILVIDAGTCLTHTAADENEHVIGGGISYGFASTLHSIGSRIHNADLDTAAMLKAATAMLAKRESLDPFPKETVDAILTNVMGEVSLNLQRVVKQYIERVGPLEGTDDDGVSPKMRHVIVVGGDEAIIKDLLQPGAPYFPMDDKMPNYMVHTMKHAIALGVSFMLTRKFDEYKKQQSGKQGELMRLLLGKRVAKNFTDAKLNSQIFRGTITAVSDEEDGSFLAMIRYDDDDVEELQPTDLWAALNLYKSVGEAHVGRPTEELIEISNKKKKAAEVASSALHDAFPEVKNLAETVHNAAVAAAKKPTMIAAPAKRSILEASPPPSKKKKLAEKPDPNSFKGRRAAKYFDKVAFYGTIDGFTEELDGEEAFWHITYDDGDAEEYDDEDLKAALKLYEKIKDNDPRSNL